MKICIIIPSIRRFEYWAKYSNDFKKYGHEPDIYVIDEEYGEARDNNKVLMGNQVEFFGRKERQQWFKDRDLEDSVIPPKAHAEISFGLLVAYEMGDYDMVVFVDDDTYPKDSDFLGKNWMALNSTTNITSDLRKWVNVTGGVYYPRGYPYGERVNPTNLNYESPKTSGTVVLNQGLWTGVPDMNAVDILARGGLDGRCTIDLKVEGSNIIGFGSYVTVCSMNLSFRPEIIPAFYQLYMNREMMHGIDRFDDIWSGVFLKKILDHVGTSMSYGVPLCVHDKQPRDIFRDVKAEMEGLIINETLWKVVDEIELTESGYLNSYFELASKLSEQRHRFHLPDYIEFMCRKMMRWTRLIEKIES